MVSNDPYDPFHDWLFYILIPLILLRLLCTCLIECSRWWQG